MTQVLLLPLMAYAACGLILSLAVHLLSLFGLQVDGNALFFGLHVGIFPLWLAVVLIAIKLTNGMRLIGMTDMTGIRYWKVVFSGCPAWMRYMTYGFMIYALVNFVSFIIVAPTGKQIGGDPPAAVWRGFSGHWMVFYAVGLAILTTAYRRGLSNLGQRCPNGHSIGFDDKFCPTCGAPITEQRG